MQALAAGDQEAEGQGGGLGEGDQRDDGIALRRVGALRVAGVFLFSGIDVQAQRLEC